MDPEPEDGGVPKVWKVAEALYCIPTLFPNFIPLPGKADIITSLSAELW